MCGLKQSVRHVYAVSFAAKDIRPVVMGLNEKRQRDEQAGEAYALQLAQQQDGDDDDHDDDENEEQHLDDESSAAASEGSSNQTRGAHNHLPHRQAHAAAPRLPPVDWSVFSSAEEEGGSTASSAHFSTTSSSSASFAFAERSAAPVESRSSPARSRAPKRPRASPAREPLRSLDNAPAHGSSEWSAASFAVAAASSPVSAACASSIGTGLRSSVPSLSGAVPFASSPAPSSSPVSNRWSAFFDNEEEDGGGNGGTEAQESEQPPAAKYARVEPNNANNSSFGRPLVSFSSLPAPPQAHQPQQHLQQRQAQSSMAPPSQSRFGASSGLAPRQLPSAHAGPAQPRHFSVAASQVVSSSGTSRGTCSAPSVVAASHWQQPPPPASKSSINPPSFAVSPLSLASHGPLPPPPPQAQSSSVAASGSRWAAFTEDDA
jgi:hypothetical protein